MVKEKESKTGSGFFVAWYQRSKKQLENEVSDKQEGNDRKFSGRRHYIFFPAGLQVWSKIGRFWVVSISEKSATNSQALTHFKMHWLYDPQASQSNKGRKKKEKKEKASSVCFQNSGWKSSTEYLSYAQGSLVHTEFNWHFTLKSHHKVTPGSCTCVFIPCRAISKLGRTSAEL